MKKAMVVFLIAAVIGTGGYLIYKAIDNRNKKIVKQGSFIIEVDMSDFPANSFTPNSFRSSGYGYGYGGDDFDKYDNYYYNESDYNYRSGWLSGD